MHSPQAWPVHFARDWCIFQITCQQIQSYFKWVYITAYTYFAFHIFKGVSKIYDHSFPLLCDLAIQNITLQFPLLKGCCLTPYVWHLTVIGLHVQFCWNEDERWKNKKSNTMSHVVNKHLFAHPNDQILLAVYNHNTGTPGKTHNLNI